MADAVDTHVLFKGNRKYTVRLTNISDGTGEATVKKVDRSTLIGPDKVNAPAKLVLEEASWNVQGFTSVRLLWDDTTDELMSAFAGVGYNDYRPWGGLVPSTDASADVTADKGDILLTTAGAAAGATYDILLVFRMKQ